MRVTLNGKPTDIPDRCTVAGLLEHLQMKPRGIAVEINLEIVPHSGFGERALAAGDAVEVLRMVGGG